MVAFSHTAISVALVGCGHIMVHHVSAMLASAVPITVTALIDPNAERRACIASLLPSPPPAAYASLDELLSTPTNTSVDVVFIAVPHDLHETLALQAFAAGKHVVLEKPLAPTIAACRALLGAIRSSPTRGMLIAAEQSPHWEEVVAARKLIAQGAIGNVVAAAAYYYESMRDNALGGLGWRRSVARAGGGVVIDGGLHWLRPLREMLGMEVEAVVATTHDGVVPELGMEGESLAHALLKMRPRRGGVGEGNGGEGGGRGRVEGEGGWAGDGGSGGAAGAPSKGGDSGGRTLVSTFSANVLATAPMAHADCPYFRVTGTDGEIVIKGTGLHAGGGARLYNSAHPEGVELLPADRQRAFFLGFRGLWDRIAEIITTDDRVGALQTVKMAAADVAVALAIYDSSRTGRWVNPEMHGDDDD